MYDDSDIEAAVRAGVLTPEAAGALRAHVAADRATTIVDEENFRLLTGFNDIFVTIAAILLLAAIAMLFGGAAAIAVAATAWGLAEYFTRRRRMALPSIVLLIAFVGAVIVQVAAVGDSTATAALAGAAAAYGHWRRFHVPITMAALAVSLVGTIIGLVKDLLPSAVDAMLVLVLVGGIALFAFAMWWDMSDRERVTRRSDVAFWLHLAAAPMIAHPVFWLLGISRYGVGGAEIAVVLLLYGMFGLVALAIDRRALLVSSLAYVLYAMSALVREFGMVGTSMALTALVIGSALLLLSAFWHPLRRRLVLRLSPALQRVLPVLDRPALAPAARVQGS